MARTSYLIGIGCNRRHGRHGAPAAVVAAALAALAEAGLAIAAVSPVVRSAAIGSDREFANTAARIDTDLSPPALLDLLKAIEHAFGRRRGRRWGARVLDLDILVWSQGPWPPRLRPRTGRLVVPHRALPVRGFALGPAARIAPDWRLAPGTRTVRHAEAVRRRPHPVDRPRRRS